MDIAHLALALGASLTAGLNLYLTVFSLGLMHRLEWMELPEAMTVAADPWVMGTAALLFLVEFVADKVPYVDNTWDTVHTFIRVPAGAFLAASAFASVEPSSVWIAALVGGAITFTTHGAKASTRLAANASPEPFSNTILSLAEDALSLSVLWLIATHPYLAVLLCLILIAMAIGVIYFFYRFFRGLFRKRRLPAASEA